MRVNLKLELEHKHILNRFIYYWERLNELFKLGTTNESTTTVYIFVVEKWFHKMTMQGYLRLPENICREKTAKFWLHKSQIPNIIYFADMSMPKTQCSLGRVLFFQPLLLEVKAKRNSESRMPGTTYLQPVTMDRTNFNDTIIKVLKATLEKLPDATSIRIIPDFEEVIVRFERSQNSVFEKKLLSKIQITSSY